MKTTIKISSMLSLALLLFFASDADVMAQKRGKKAKNAVKEVPVAAPVKEDIPTNKRGCPKFSDDKQKTMESASLYSEYYKQKDYATALPYWRYVYNNASGLQQNTYIRGEIMFKELIAGVEDDEDQAELKERYVDTLFMILDKRAKCWGGEGTIAGKKGLYMSKYRPEQEDEKFRLYQEAVDKSGDDLSYAIIPPFFMKKYDDYRDNIIKKEDFDALYLKLKEVADNNIKNKTKNAAKFQEMFYDGNNSLESLYEQVNEVDILQGVDDCASAKEVFGGRYKEDPNDVKSLKNYYSALRKFDCTNDPDFLAVLLKLNELEPDAGRAEFAAKKFEKAGDQANADKFYRRAIELTTDPVKKASFVYRLAYVAYKKKQFSESRELCLEAAALRPNWGEPYMLIGSMYAASGKLCGPGTGWESQVVVWPAMDMWQKAKSVDPEVADEAQAKINKYYAYLPLKSEAFMKGYSQGQGTRVGCWIQRSTTMRFKD